MPDLYDPSELSAAKPSSVSAFDPSELSATPPATIRAGEPGVLDYVRRFVFGGPDKETMAGRAWPSMSGAVMQNTPPDNALSFGDLIPSAKPGTEQQGGIGYMGIPYGAHSTDTLRGAAQALNGLTTGPNTLIMAGTGGLGSIPAATGYTAVSLKAVNAALGAYFTYQMGKGASDAMTAANAAHLAGNDEEASRLLGFAGLSGLLAAAGVLHAGGNVKGILETKVPRPALNPEVVPADQATGLNAAPPAEPPTIDVQPQGSEPISATPPESEPTKPTKIPRKPKAAAPVQTVDPADLSASPLVSDAGRVGQVLQPTPEELTPSQVGSRPTSNPANPAPIAPSAPAVSPAPAPIRVGNYDRSGKLIGFDATAGAPASFDQPSQTPSDERPAALPSSPAAGTPAAAAVNKQSDEHPAALPSSPQAASPAISAVDATPAPVPRATYAPEEVSASPQEATQSDAAIAPERPSGPHGPIFAEHTGDPAAAIARLQQEQTGEVPGAWNHPHPEVGDIDLMWGKPGNPSNDFKGGYGLSHIIAKHVEARQDLDLNDLPEAVQRMQPAGIEQGNRLILQSPDHKAVVVLDWNGQAKKWLLSAYRPEDQPSLPEGPSGVSDTPQGGSLTTPPLRDSTPSAERTIDVPDTHAAERQAPLPGGPDSSVTEKAGIEQSSAVLPATATVAPEELSAQHPVAEYPHAGEKVKETIAGLPHPKMPALVDEIEAHLASRTRIKDTPSLVKLAAKTLGDGLTSGKYEVKDLYDAVETAVNRYVSGPMGQEIMRMAPDQAFAELHKLMELMPTQTARTSTQKELQQFSTPPTLSYLAVKAAAIKPGETAGEYSAGTGSIAAFLRAAGAEVETNEIDEGRRAFLTLQGYNPTGHNAERIRDLRPDLHPDSVVINPPFSSSGGRLKSNKNNIGFQHVLSALDTLPVGGRLVAILGRGASFDHPTALPLWKGIADRGARIRANLGLDGTNYAKYGTTFDNRLLVIDKTPATGEKPVSGDFKDLAEALHAIRHVIESRPAIQRSAETPESTGHVADGGVRSSDGSGEAVQPGKSGDGVSRPGRRRSGQAGGDTVEARPGADTESPARVESESRPDQTGERPAPAHAGDNQPTGRIKLETGAAEETPVERDGAYQSYKPAKLRTGVPHQEATGTGLVETGAMAAVEPPDLTYTPQLPESIIHNGHVTDAQLEAIAYAGQAHEEILPSGARQGFMVGDGTGVGKGTIAAGIALDNWNQGRKRILWLSMKGGLIKQAQRDLDWVESGIKAKILNDWKMDEPIEHEGVLFATYNTLHRADPNGQDSRLAQIEKWNPDVILMDESHAAKNAVAAGGQDNDDDDSRDEAEEGDNRRPTSMMAGTSSKAGAAVLDLDKQLPDARVTYFSATAFTDTRNLGYATRLGLWGQGTSFPRGFRDFNVQIDQGGMGMMELVAKEMKARGNYMARNMSFDGVTFREQEAPLTKGQRDMYDAAVKAWQLVLQNIDKAIEATTGEDDKKAKGLAKMRAVSQFWSSNQRFYRSLITAMKVPTAIEATQKALDEGHSVFLDLVSTGEAETQRQLTNATEQNLSFDDIDLSAKQTLISFVNNCFPVNLLEDYYDEDTQTTRTRPVLDADGKPVQSQQALALREAMLKDLNKIQLPQSPLDQFIDYFGADQVAEVSGRKSRITQDPKTGNVLEVKRVKPRGASARDVNDWERQQFQEGKKRIAIASGAGGTGFDFHSDKRNKNQQRRTHIVLEPSWSADQQMQKFGRTHRTNQANAPEYVLIASDLGGEKRFISAIASRIASLGALTRGERKAGGGAAEMLAKYNIEGEYGQAATQAFFRALEEGGGAINANDVTVSLPEPPPELAKNAMEVFRALGAVKETSEGISIDRHMPTKRFLNRVLNLPTSMQGEVFNYFMQLFEHIVDTLKRAGAFDEGTIELKALSSRIAHRETLRENATGGASQHVTVDAEFPVEQNEWKYAVKHLNSGDRADHYQAQYGGLWRNKRSGKLWMARKAMRDITDQASGQLTPAMSLVGPRAGSYSTIGVPQLRDGYERIPNDQAKTAWNAALAELPQTEHQDVHLITGSVLPIWEHLHKATGGDMKAVSVMDGEGRATTGIQIPANSVASLRDRLQGAGDFSPQVVLTRIWNNGERITLKNATLSAARVMGERAIVIQPGTKAGREILEQMGIPHVETASSVRFYLPYSDEATGEQRAETLKRLGEVLQAFPAEAKDSGEESPAATEQDPREAALARRRKGGEAGSISADLITLGLGSFIKNDVVPTAKLAAMGLAAAKDDVLKVFAPAARGEQAKATALSVRANAAQLARSTDRAKAALAIASKFFDAQSDQENFDFIDAVENGLPQANPDLDRIAATMRQMLDSRVVAVQALGTGKLQTVILDYFPHIWKDPKLAAQTFASLAKRPLQGSKSFLKKRSIATVADGLAAGLVPISTNPVDLVLAKSREMDKFLMAHRILAEMKEQGLLQFKRSTAPMPDGYAKIDDSVATVYGKPSHAGALQVEGEWVAPEPAARILNNFLSPGLREKSGMFRAYLGAANLMNQAQLGFSAFHLAFTSMDAAISKLALGIYQIAHGDVVKGLASAAQTATAPFTGIQRGDKMIKEWYAPGTQGALIGELVDAAVQAGGRAHMDEFYNTHITKAMLKAFRQFNVFGGLMRLPFAAVEQAARPIMSYLVPRQKLAVFADLAEYELSRLGTNASDPDVQAALARAWDSVDNRMGQLVYDNLFWNKVAKDLAMGSVRSVGWNVGTVREIAGGLGDTAKAAGGKGGFTPRMSYVIALPIVAGLAGAIAYYLWHGHAPEHLKDYYFPTDAKGHRWSLPTYMKDVYHYAVEPGRTLRGKVHPLANLIFEMLSNKDYFDKPIRNPHHPLVKQAEELAAHVAKAFLPISLEQGRKTQNKSLEEKVLPMVGITPAPRGLDHPGLHR